MGSRDFKQFLGYDNRPDPKELRENYYKEVLKDGTPFPNPLTYEDIDKEFRKWVEESLQLTFDGKLIPTMSLYSNQRFSEYLQSWSYNDDDKNPILNFKTISRETNPKSGTINGESKNIPGEHTWLMKRVSARDKNNREYFIEYRMKQPFSVDLSYKVSIFTNKYELVNKFNQLVNDRFKAIDAYIRPNGHYISMTLNDISDDSTYSIDDRQYYSQTCTIIVRAYIIPEDSFIVHEVPKLKVIGVDPIGDGSYADIEIGNDLRPAEIYSELNAPDECKDGKSYYYRDVTLKVFANTCDSKVVFTMDMDFTAKADKFYSVNTRFFKIMINGELVCSSVNAEIPEDIEFHNGDLVKICSINRKKTSADAQLIFGGFTRDEVVSDNDTDENQYSEEVIVKE